MCFLNLRSMVLAIQGPDIELRHTRTSFSYIFRGMRVIHSMNPTLVRIGDGNNDIIHIEEEGNGQPIVENGGTWVQPALHPIIEIGNAAGTVSFLRQARDGIYAGIQRLRQLGTVAARRYRTLRRYFVAFPPASWFIFFVLNIFLSPLVLAGVTILFWLAVAWLILYYIYEAADRIAYLAACLLDGPVETGITVIWDIARNGQAYLIRELGAFDLPTPAISPVQQQTVNQQPLNQASDQPLPDQQILDQQVSAQQPADRLAPNGQAPVEEAPVEEATVEEVPAEEASGQYPSDQQAQGQLSANQPATGQQSPNQQLSTQEQADQPVSQQTERVEWQDLLAAAGLLDSPQAGRRRQTVYKLP
ncbi:hypothetical protein C7999DRAFT_12065 [Corynascus novoguineensis]|uniref:Uncharacterized protein n=1 Tax=Corynascus novoguineensis TaxID=1126955 RepID=A0AAN7D036_9PEZI|nr:hypothetical protein C7999DRAFT_12065 [Corynascus novoguineensis]